MDGIHDKKNRHCYNTTDDDNETDEDDIHNIQGFTILLDLTGTMKIFPEDEKITNQITKQHKWRKTGYTESSSDKS